MTNRFIQKGWAPKQPLDYFLQEEIRGAMFSISEFVLTVERAQGFRIWLVGLQCFSRWLGRLWCHNQNCLDFISLIWKIRTWFHFRIVGRKGHKSCTQEEPKQMQTFHLPSALESDTRINPIAMQKPLVAHQICHLLRGKCPLPLSLNKASCLAVSPSDRQSYLRPFHLLKQKLFWS